ncbi:MAG: phosphonate C-P lyase system protein PhnH [Desulfobacula sp.]|jgi:alpha-D-ribose 1-methylphosphonate 5-triphosphate synthase subunit PhnH|uniref:phosphonate C-P lyase system protein PhnH n=1 Tax=Desulfobacula sp. TaxID=2593537 RepID=UPI001D4B0012|nr:phosphonate C-P lyase system protein PhnH [Desulfobacula sp.]MBT5539767.1 phosphonate C-P lyase system protein PhnH [Candidatus Neomarinimicrobiota bacterium]MBT3487492.1 phosphonate C-P lyase system protein PhnH [Desulfobacula sp.]MBT3806919.1 phosphonate C-P lyase system protein PhnH [Desulfobacula sp.]MBT4027178.1 phosphonate C-P lyase system protein PhnH [Desulfobacula sp.]
MLQGFQSETNDSQSVFRKLLTAMASPGSIEKIDLDIDCPGNLHSASGGILLTLLDFETPFWTDLDDSSKEIQWIQFHTSTPVKNSATNSLFALCTHYDELEDPNLFNPGTLSSPDLSTTLLIQTRGIDNNGKIRLTGPGIQTEAYLRLKGIKEVFLKRRARMVENYPQGIDMIFICENRFVCVPRTTILEVF